jgi:hypothetical protein
MSISVEEKSMFKILINFYFRISHTNHKLNIHCRNLNHFEVGSFEDICGVGTTILLLRIRIPPER